MLDNYLIIHKSILPEYYSKVMEVRHLMESGKCREISQAVKQVGISRSTYYKYKDFIYEPSDLSKGRKAVISVMLIHEPGILSAMLSVISQAGASVYAITQSPPIHETASVTVTLEISAMTGTMAELMDELSQISGLENPKILAVE